MSVIFIVYVQKYHIPSDIDQFDELMFVSHYNRI